MSFVEQNGVGLIQNLDSPDSEPTDSEQIPKESLFYDLDAVPPLHIIIVYSIQVEYALETPCHVHCCLPPFHSMSKKFTVVKNAQCVITIF